MKRVLLQSAGVASLLISQAQAIIIGGAVTGGSALSDGGTFIELAAPIGNPHGSPNSVGNDTFQNSNLYGFNEDQNVLVRPGNLNLNVAPPGEPLSIAAGTEVASHYIFFDPNGARSQQGYVDFDAGILAVITETTNLSASDYLANTGVNYLNPGFRGLEGGDNVKIDPLNPSRLLVSWTASTPGDYVRVLTKHSPGAVPEGGSTFGLLALGVLGLGWAGCRQRC